MWILTALLSALFAGVTSILVKLGVKNTDSDVATALRTGVVLVFAALMTLIVGSFPTISAITVKEWIFLILSGIATGASWLCYYNALKTGVLSVVVPIDKLSVLVTVAFSTIVLKEKFKPKAWVGLSLIVVFTIIMALFLLNCIKGGMNSRSFLMPFLSFYAGAYSRPIF